MNTVPQSLSISFFAIFLYVLVDLAITLPEQSKQIRPEKQFTNFQSPQPADFSSQNFGQPSTSWQSTIASFNHSSIIVSFFSFSIISKSSSKFCNNNTVSIPR